MPNKSTTTGKKYWLILIFITVITFFPRAAQVFNPYNYFFDPEQGTEYLVTKSIVVDHQIVLTAHQGGFGLFSKGAGFNYILAIPFILDKGDPFGGRILMLVISVLTVSLAFILANRMFGLRTATIIGFLLAMSPILKDYAGGISPPFIIPLLTVLLIYFLFRAFNEENKFIPLVALIVGLMVHFETAAMGILSALLVLTGLMSLVKKQIPYRHFILGIIFFTLPMLPIIIFDVGHNFENTRGVIKMLEMTNPQDSSQLYHNLWDLLGNRFNIFSWNFISTFSPNLTIWLFVLGLILLGVFLFARDKKVVPKKKIFILYLGLMPAITFLALMVYPGKFINQWWITYLSVIYCFLLGVVLNYLWDKNKFKPLIALVALILGLAFITRTIFIYKTQFIYPPNNYIREISVIKYVFEDAKGKPFGLQVFAKRDQANYDYLIWWIGNSKYKYQPYREKKGLYYIIIEPNYYPLLKTKVTLASLSAGVLLKTKQLPNGFIIEKRLVN